MEGKNGGNAHRARPGLYRGAGHWRQGWAGYADRHGSLPGWAAGSCGQYHIPGNTHASSHSHVTSAEINDDHHILRQKEISARKL